MGGLSAGGPDGDTRLGLLGGTFDPPHRMHLSIARAAQAQLALTRVLFVPAGDPWRKAGRQISPAEHRLAMTRLAVAAQPGFHCSDIELRRPGPSHTLDTLTALRAQGVEQLWFIVGSDALADLPHWHQPQQIIAAARLAVVTRPGSEISPPALNGLLAGLAARVDWVTLAPDALSASELRRRIGDGPATAGASAPGPSGTDDVPPAVAEYARRHRLYGGAAI